MPISTAFNDLLVGVISRSCGFVSNVSIVNVIIVAVSVGVIVVVGVLGEVIVIGAIMCRIVLLICTQHGSN